MSQWLFVAAAKGLQGYVLRSDPLKEMVGASEWIESLPRADGTGFLAKVLADLEVSSPPKVLTDASGAARLLFDAEEDARRLARIWPLLASQYAPGLEVAVALVKVESEGLGPAIEDAERELNVNRNEPMVFLPEAGPEVARNRRTGLPAARLVRPLDSEDDHAGWQEPVDEESARKRQAAQWTSAHTLLNKVVPEDLRSLVPQKPDDWARQRLWPLDLTKLATDDNAYIAVIHADANGLGAAMMACVRSLRASRTPDRTYAALCGAIEAASVAAAQAAMRPLLQATQAQTRGQHSSKRNGQPVVPARPLVCAGEDFTCVVRAKHAISFAEDYLVALERETAQRFAALPEPIPGLKGLTGCAGVVFCRNHFPFSRAYALAERLCAFAKERTAREASAVAFLRLKSSLQPSDDYHEVLDHAFRAGTGPEQVLLSMNPYRVGSKPNRSLADLGDLRGLVEALDSRRHPGLPHSGLRGVVTRAYEGKSAADEAFERLKLVVQEREPRTWDGLASALKKLTGSGGLWRAEADAATPLYDALELLHLQL